MARQPEPAAGLPDLPGLDGVAIVTLAPASARFIFWGASAAAEAAGAAFGLSLPVEPCRANREGSRAALWLGPDEWLLLADTGEQSGLAAGMAAGLAGLPHALVDVAERTQGLRVDGPRAQDVLAAGCPLDLDVTAFTADACTRTLFGKAEIVLWRTAAHAFRLEVTRSFLPYVVAMLDLAIKDAAALAKQSITPPRPAP